VTEQDNRNSESPAAVAGMGTPSESPADGDAIRIDEEGCAEDVEVSDPVATVEALTAALDAKSAELAQEKEKYLRALADMDNLRKRCRRDVEDARIRGIGMVLEELLPALDSIDLALSAIVPDETCQAIYDGMMMVRRQFLSATERFEMKPIDAAGRKFDPALHEAVSYVPSTDVEAGMVIKDLRCGYTLGERLLRATMVQVSSGPPVSKAPEMPPPDAAPVDGSDDGTVGNGEVQGSGAGAQDGEVKDGE